MYKMQIFMVVACFAAVILQEGGTQTNSPQRAVRELVRRIAKRQIDLDCFYDELSNDDASSQCETVADEGLDFTTDEDFVYQSTVNAVYEQFCKPECGNPILAALDKCGAEDSVIDFLSGLCGTNSNGDRCYESYVSSFNLQNTELSCYTTYNLDEYCNCRSELESAVETQGCCLKVYQDYFSTIYTYDLNKLYDECDVNVPRRCNNSPISGSQALALNVAVFIIALAMAIIG